MCRPACLTMRYPVFKRINKKSLLIWFDWDPTAFDAFAFQIILSILSFKLGKFSR